MIFKNIVINFHKIENTEWLERVFNLIRKYYTLIPINDIEQYYYHNKKLENSCHITFDDGDISFYNIVFPLLKKYKIPVSIYVSPLVSKEQKNFWFQEIRGYNKDKLTEIVSKYAKFDSTLLYKIPLNAVLKSFNIDTIWQIINQYQKETNIPPKHPMNMTPDQLHELLDSGLIAIGAHTLTHLILRNETYEKAAYEIKKSINDLRNLLNTEVKYFTYPNGKPQLDFSKREMNILNDLGIKLAFSTENKAISCSDNPLSIPRSGVTYGNHLLILTKLLAGKKWDYVRKLFKGKTEEDYRKMLLLAINKN